jgi:hypothetical protein
LPVSENNEIDEQSLSVSILQHFGRTPTNSDIIDFAFSSLNLPNTFLLVSSKY